MQLSSNRCLSSELVNGDDQCGWCEALYEAKSAELILYGRALGLSHAEAEDVLQETFVKLVKLLESPLKPENYCVRCFRNGRPNYRRHFAAPCGRAPTDRERVSAARQAEAAAGIAAGRMWTLPPKPERGHSCPQPGPGWMRLWTRPESSSVWGLLRTGMSALRQRLAEAVRF